MSALLVATLSLALLCGLGAKMCKLPPMIGFLAAGYLLYATGVRSTEGLEALSDLGVTALLFTIGLKLNLRQLASPLVAGAGLIHMGLWTALCAGGLMLLKATGWSLLADLRWGPALVIGLSLAFSSTVYVVKLLDSRGQQQSRYGAVAIGVLVIQDLVAVLFMTASAGHAPSPWALCLLALPLAYLPVKLILAKIGHGELLVLAGLVAAFGGYFLFYSLGLKGDLGALIMGVMISRTPQAKELYSRLSAIKELLLIAFFVHVGLIGLPNWAMCAMALILLAILPLKSGLYLALFSVFQARPRLAAMTSATLTNYSEFAMVVGSVAAGAGWISESWVSMLALALAGSFLGSAVVFRFDHTLLDMVVRQVPRRHPVQMDVLPGGSEILPPTNIPSPAAPSSQTPDSAAPDFSGVQAIVLGMGRVGQSSYRRLREVHGLEVAGLESDPARVESLRGRGARIYEGDATDPELWEAIDNIEGLRYVISTMPIQEDLDQVGLFSQIGTHHADTRKASGELRQYRVVVACRFPDQRDMLLRAGADEVIYIYGGAGAELADLAVNPSAQDEANAPF